ncbi:MAG: TonB-dependent receptor, partial [bacterium]|nr:TonB-dependent receptor [bacterium]
DDARYPGPTPASDGGGVDETGFVYDPSGIKGQRWLLFNGFGLMLEYQQDSRGETDEEAVYLQDSLRIGDYFTLNLGVRADAFNSRGGGSDPDTGEFIDNSQFPDRQLDFSFDDMVAPRIGFTADVTRNGRSKLYGHFGRFYESVPLDINARAFGTELFNFYYFYYPSDGSLPTGSNPGTWFYSYPLGTGVGVSSDIKPMYTEEALIGFEYGVTDNVSVGVKYTERSIEDVIEDISVDGGNTYFITNPGGTVTVNPVTGAPLATPAVFPVPSRDYTALELTVQKRYSNNWQIFASYVNSENKGNYGGLFRQDNGQLDPNITSLYDLPSLLVGAEGLLPNDREHQFKVYGSYATPINLLIGFYGQFLSGTPISKLGAHPIYGNSERFVIPRGSFGTTPDIWNIDLHFEYPINIGDKGELKLICDVFNVTDQQEPSQVDQDWTFQRLTATVDPNECGGAGTGPGTACPNGNPDFNSALDYQRPQTFRFGVKFSF